MIGGESDSGTGISIHAPVKGATTPPIWWYNKIIISIHAPVKGATRLSPLLLLLLPYFNPRSREGSDALISGETAKERISIHAPVKGATLRLYP